MYRVVLRPRVERQVLALPASVRSRVRRATFALAVDPRPPGCRKLTGEPDLWRVRVGDFRVVYHVDDALALVTVFRVGHRSDIYR